MDNPNVILDGKSFPVPPLSLGQIRSVIPAILGLGKLAATGDALTPEYFDLVATVLFEGLRKGTPSLTKDAINDMHIPPQALRDACDVIARQCGMKPGEALAGENQTGTK